MKKQPSDQQRQIGHASGVLIWLKPAVNYSPFSQLIVFNNAPNIFVPNILYKQDSNDFLYLNRHFSMTLICVRLLHNSVIGLILELICMLFSLEKSLF
jgi:hypothetical protein